MSRTTGGSGSSLRLFPYPPQGSVAYLPYSLTLQPHHLRSLRDGIPVTVYSEQKPNHLLLSIRQLVELPHYHGLSIVIADNRTRNWRVGVCNNRQQGDILAAS